MTLHQTALSLSPALQETVDCLKSFADSQGKISLTIRELVQQLGLKSPAPLQVRLDKLVELGILTPQ